MEGWDKKEIKRWATTFNSRNDNRKSLKNLNIRYNIINEKSNFKKIIKKLCLKAKKNNEVVALLVRKNTFENKYYQKQNNSKLMLKRASVKLDC